MKTFIKKPVAIKAHQWNVGDKPLDCMVAYGESVIEQYPTYKGFYFIETLEGNHHVSDRDYVIQGVAGEYYPCKPDIFKKTYWTEIEYIKQNPSLLCTFISVNDKDR